jgi:hypothetical protein
MEADEGMGQTAKERPCLASDRHGGEGPRRVHQHGNAWREPRYGKTLLACCESHRPFACCDPDDCGPCCETCPTCPSHTVLILGPATSGVYRARDENMKIRWFSSVPRSDDDAWEHMEFMAHLLEFELGAVERKTTNWGTGRQIQNWIMLP